MPCCHEQCWVEPQVQFTCLCWGWQEQISDWWRYRNSYWIFFALKQLANLWSLTVWWFDEITLLSSHGIHCRCFSNIWLWERLNYISEEAHCCILLTFLGFFKIAVFPVKFWTCWPWIHATVVISIDMLFFTPINELFGKFCYSPFVSYSM